MLTNSGKIYKLKLWSKDTSPKYAMLINMKSISQDIELKDVNESAISGTLSYKRQKINSNEWSVPTLINDVPHIFSAEKTFGPFTGTLEVTHLGVCSAENGTDGELLFFIPVKHFVENKTPRKYEAGEQLTVRIVNKEE